MNSAYNDLYLVASSGATRRLTTSELASQPSVAGQTVVYLRREDKESADAPVPPHEVRRLDLRTNTDTAVAYGQSLGGVDLSADGTLIAVSSLRTPAARPLDPGTRTEPLEQNDLARIYILEAGSGRVLSVLTGVTRQEKESQRKPSLSPDGRYVAYRSATATLPGIGEPAPLGFYSVRIAPVDGSSAPVRVASLDSNWSSRVTDLSWSADGSRMGISASDQDSSRLVVVDREGQPVSEAFADQPELSADFTDNGHLQGVLDGRLLAQDATDRDLSRGARVRADKPADYDPVSC